jgi:hypothetical protein
MGERTDQLPGSDDRDQDLLAESVTGSTPGHEPDVDAGPGPADRSTTARNATVTDRVRARLASPFSGLFSVRVFVRLLAVTMVSTVLAGVVVPLGGVAGFLGIAVAGFAVGLADERHRYLEFGLAGAIAAGLATVFDHLLLTALGLGIPLVALGVGAGALAGIVGHYFGRDLRHGLTREL